MAKTKKYTKRSKSRKLKRGGRKQNNMALQTTQMVGGQAVGGPQPAPAVALTRLGYLDEQSVITSLQSFGDAVLDLKAAVYSGYDTVASLESAVAAQKSALNSLKSSSDSLVSSVTGENGVYKKIVGTDFVATPVSPAPRPAPRPAPF